MILTISQSKWSFGKGTKTVLLDDFGYRDCMGFYLQSLHYPDSELLNKAELVDVNLPNGALTNLLDWSEKKTSYQTNSIYQGIIESNDDPKLELKVRKEKLCYLFELLGISLDFKD